MDVTISLKPDDWTRILEQILLVILIMGRWLLPKGNISRFEKRLGQKWIFFFAILRNCWWWQGAMKLHYFNFLDKFDYSTVVGVF